MSFPRFRNPTTETTSPLTTLSELIINITTAFVNLIPQGILRLRPSTEPRGTIDKDIGEEFLPMRN
jgi:hypothetical protein